MRHVDSGPPLRILGVDPGSRVTGFGVIERHGQLLRYVTSGCIRTREGDIAQRLGDILDGLRDVIAQTSPQCVAIEKVFVNVNPQSTLLLGQARGAALSAVVLARLPIAEYSALQVKQSVVGTGRAAKSQVQEMVKRLLRLSGVPGPDAADALACAICHAHLTSGAFAARHVLPGRRNARSTRALWRSA